MNEKWNEQKLLSDLPRNIRAAIYLYQIQSRPYQLLKSAQELQASNVMDKSLAAKVQGLLSLAKRRIIYSRRILLDSLDNGKSACWHYMLCNCRATVAIAVIAMFRPGWWASNEPEQTFSSILARCRLPVSMLTMVSPKPSTNLLTVITIKLFSDFSGSISIFVEQSAKTLREKESRSSSRSRFWQSLGPRTCHFTHHLRLAFGRLGSSVWSSSIFFSASSAAFLSLYHTHLLCLIPLFNLLRQLHSSLDHGQVRRWSYCVRRSLGLVCCINDPVCLFRLCHLHNRQHIRVRYAKAKLLVMSRLWYFRLH